MVHFQCSAFCTHPMPQEGTRKCRDTWCIFSGPKFSIFLCTDEKFISEQMCDAVFWDGFYFRVYFHFINHICVS
jgi:hypothetical protein